jgi:hypothetical protein
MLRLLAILVGICFIIIGVLGFMPEFTSQGRLMGTIATNSISNIIHLATGILGLMCGVKGTKLSRYFFIALGMSYGILALLGFYDSSLAFFRYVVTNGASNIFHAVIAIIALALGFGLINKHSND